VSLAIDHFGSGYSTLVYLKEFGVDTLKIDRAFIQDIATNENNGIVVRAIIQLAHNLGIRVIACGVENQEGYDRLHTFGCDVAQGDFLGKPMAAKDCLRWVDAQLAARSPRGKS
jgi:diguanylate cyclase